MDKNWGPAPTVDGGPSTVTGRQGAVLDVLRDDDRRPGESGLKVGDVAEALHLHANTVREHLDALVERGFAVRSRAPGTGRGRPAWLYRLAASSSDPRFSAYRGMSLALAAHLTRTSDDPGADARELGREWGRELGSAVGQDADQRIVDDLDRLGFAPTAEADGTLALTRCPLLDAARQYPEVTCQIHLGLIRGILDDDGGDEDTEPVLVPFARRGACTLRLSPNTRP